MKRFRSGNVVRLAGTNGSLAIITGYRTVELSHPPKKHEVCDYVFVNYEGMSGGSRLDTITKEVECTNEYENPCCDDTCEECGGTGKVTETEWGMDEAVLVASNVKEWITQTLTDKFNF